jgi:acyl carrier protein
MTLHDELARRKLMDAAHVVARTRTYIAENFLYMRPDLELAEDDLLLEKRIVDSMGMVELVAFLEDEFGIDLDDGEITESNFATLGAIARFVVAKGGAGIRD